MMMWDEQGYVIINRWRDVSLSLETFYSEGAICGGVLDNSDSRATVCIRKIYGEPEGVTVIGGIGEARLPLSEYIRDASTSSSLVVNSSGTVLSREGVSDPLGLSDREMIEALSPSSARDRVSVSRSPSSPRHVRASSSLSPPIGTVAYTVTPAGACGDVDEGEEEK